jgi:hypothetical protein
MLFSFDFHVNLLVRSKQQQQQQQQSSKKFRGSLELLSWCSWVLIFDSSHPHPIHPPTYPSSLGLLSTT